MFELIEIQKYTRFMVGVQSDFDRIQDLAMMAAKWTTSDFHTKAFLRYTAIFKIKP